MDAEGDGCLLDLDYLLQLLGLPETLFMEIMALRSYVETVSQPPETSGQHLQSAASSDSCHLVLELLAALANHMCLLLW